MRRIAIALLITACSESEDPSGLPEPEPAVEWVTLECDPIAPAYCGHPFPSNVFTVADSSTPTGRRVQLSVDSDHHRTRYEMAKSSGSKTTTIGRNANTGRFTPVSTARNKPATHVVERVPKPGYGDTKK